VAVFAADPLKWTWPSRFITLGRPDQSGGYQVTGLAPDDYLAIALPQVSGSMWGSPEVLSALAGKATRFQLRASEAKTLALKLVK
jgi:hypothetical protein